MCDTGGCRLQWYVISDGQRTGPYSASQLSELIRQNRLSLNSYVLIAGSKVARRLSCAPEAIYSDFLPINVPHSQRQAPKFSEENRTIISPRDNLFSTNNPPQPNQSSEWLQGASNANLAENKANHAEKLKQLALAEEARQRTEHQEREQRREDLAQARTPMLPDGYLSRKYRKRAYPTEGKKVVRPEQQKTRNPIPKFLARSKRQNDAPSHQLPKAASEAQMRVQDGFNWAKNRVNPTAPRSVYHATGRNNRKSRRRRKNFWTSMEFLITAGVLIALSIVAAALLSNQSGHHQPIKPRFTTRKEVPRETGVAERGQGGSDQSQEKNNAAQETKPRQEEAPNPPKASAERSKPVSQKNSTTSRTAKKQSSKPRKEQTKQRKDPKATRQDKRPPARLQTKLPARSPPAKRALPSGWPALTVSSGRELAAHKFKVVTVTNVSLLQKPDFCQPCQVPAKLSDGTRVLLSSPSSTPWKRIIKSRAKVINAKALVTQSAENYYTLVVQDLSP